jgi:lysozyme family protein
MRYGTKWPQYAAQLNRMVIKPSRLAELTRYAEFALAHKDTYLAVEKATGVTWPHVAVLHRRESDADFRTYLGNGDPLNRRTTHVPRGRGPFNSFQAGAIDALHLDGLDRVLDWRIEKVLYYCEVFNGAGYDMHGRPSPYVWGGTNIQQAGKYIADGEWSSSAWDSQPGCAPILALIVKLDPTVIYQRET